MQKINRDRAVDSIKYLAIILILFIHFLYFYAENLLVYLRNAFPFSLVFQGLSAKAGLAIFAVITGYFSFKDGKRKEAVRYIAGKYLFYFCMSVFANLLYFVIDHDHLFVKEPIWYVFENSFLLEDKIYYYLWFVRSFFIGDVLCYFIGKLNVPWYGTLLFYVTLALTGHHYLAVIVSGCLLALLMERDHKILNNNVLHIIMILSIFALIKKEHKFIFEIYGICSVFLFIAVKKNKLLHWIFDNKITSFFGRYTMYILIVHYALMYALEVKKLGSLDATFIVWFLLTHLSALLISVPISKTYGLLIKGLDKVLDLIGLKEKSEC